MSTTIEDLQGSLDKLLLTLFEGMLQQKDDAQCKIDLTSALTCCEEHIRNLAGLDMSVEEQEAKIARLQIEYETVCDRVKKVAVEVRKQEAKAIKMLDEELENNKDAWEFGEVLTEP
jgi:hypothetical protein